MMPCNRPLRRLLVTGGAGFIGSSFIRHGLNACLCERIVNLDLLTYAADLRNLSSCENDPRYRFVQGDVCDEQLVETVCAEEKIDAIVHFAAETHVDKSIADPKIFCHTNIFGTLSLLETVRKQPHIHYHHISTDEVYGSLAEDGYFVESSPYRPNSPYAASKAAADHFVRAYAHTYGLSVTLSHCTNNYGPCQHSEKLIPKMIASLVHKQPLPLYGQGLNVRDWIFVDDHSEAVWAILAQAKSGETYGIGGECEKSNLQLVHELIDAFAEMSCSDSRLLRSLITMVPDRAGHDFRYAIHTEKLKQDMQWRAKHAFADGLRQTLAWYLENQDRLLLVSKSS
jgi:dTDP-glucose 4,6-dehydratase